MMVRIVLVLAGVSVLCISCTSNEDRDIASTRAWLAQISTAKGIIGPLPPAGESRPVEPTFEEWIERGRSIPGGRERLEKWVLEANPDGDLEAAAWALGGLGDERSVPALAAQARQGNRLAVMSLGKIGGEKACVVLYEILERRLDVNIRVLAATSLVKCAPDRGVLCASLTEIAEHSEFLLRVVRRQLAELRCDSTAERSEREGAAGT